MDCKERLRDCFDEMVVYKDLKKTNFFSALSLPSFMRDWLLKKFEDENGNFDKDDMVRFVKKYIPRKDDWTSIKNRVIVEGERVKFLAKISIDIDVKTGQVSFALPDFGLGYKDTIVEGDVWAECKDDLVRGNDVWGMIELGYRSPEDFDIEFEYESKRSRGKTSRDGRIRLISFKNFCPYQIDLDQYKDARREFSTDEWIDIILGAVDYNANASQPYSFARKPKKALTDARATIAACIGAEPEEIYFTSGGTESDNWAIKGLIEPNDKHQTITSQIEHHAVLNACNALERLGYPVVYLPVDSQGVVLSDSLSKAITEKTKLVSVMMVNNEIGTIEPIKELATIAHTHNVLFHTDAVQAVGHIPIDVNELGIDMLSSSAHKFNGPKGIGFLYIRKGTQIRPLADGGAQEFHMRAGTENIASIVGMAVALKKNCRTMQETSTKLQAMDHAFIDVLHEANIDFIRNGSVSKSPGIISVSIRNISGEMLLHRLDLKGISISTGSACDSVNTQVSHVIKAIGVPSAYAQGTIRISFGHDNQIEDAVEIAHAIAKILQT